MSECYCDFDQYMAHVKQTVHIRPERSHHYHLCICPTMVPRLTFQGNYILSLPTLLYFRNMLTYTVLTLDCTSSYVHLWTLKHVDMQCLINVF